MEWAARVQRLEAELYGLRRAMRGRAVIEQAKGLLAGTLGISTEDAFDHLSRLSQHENLRLVEVAARIVGTALPANLADEMGAPQSAPDLVSGPGPEEVPAAAVAEVGPVDAGTGASPDLPAPLRVRLQAATAAVSSASGPMELAALVLADGLADLDAEAVAIYLAEPDGALALAGSAGLSAQVASNWQRVPSPVRTPAGEAVSSARPVWLNGTAGHPYQLVGPGGARAALPLRQPAGAIEVIWAGPRNFPAGERGYLSALASAVAAQLARTGTGGERRDAPDYLMHAALEVVPAPLFLIVPVRDEAGEVVDFLIEFASEQAGDPHDKPAAALIGSRLLDVRPALAVNGVFEAYREVLRTGVPWRRGVTAETVLTGGAPRVAEISRAAVRVGTRLVVSWQVHDAEVALARAAEAEELGRFGYGEWPMGGGSPVWTAGLFRIFERSPQQGPLTLDEIPQLVTADDLPGLERDLAKVLIDKRPVDTQFDVRVGRAVRALRAIVAPVYDDAGELTAVRMVVQDITDMSVRVATQRRSAQAAAMRRVHRPGRRAE
jgi:hypothetical protein